MISRVTVAQILPFFHGVKMCIRDSIHTDGTCNLSGSLTYAFATAPAAQQTRTAVKINPQSADIYAEGIPATFPSEDGKTVYTALSYNGSTYMPLRTVGRWMGKNISLSLIHI